MDFGFYLVRGGCGGGAVKNKIIMAPFGVGGFDGAQNSLSSLGSLASRGLFLSRKIAPTTSSQSANLVAMSKRSMVVFGCPCSS
jgi:hypothetical protein